MEFSNTDTAIVVTDPQNDVLRKNNMVWGLVGETVESNRTVENLKRLIEGAAANDYNVFISPHYNYATDAGWKFGGPIENMMHESQMFHRDTALSLEGFAGSGADWLDILAPTITDGKTVVTSPHKLFGSQTNDLIFQLRKRGISKVILGGMLANLCVESHLRDLLEAGFEVAVVNDAVAAPKHPELGDGNVAAQINYKFLANTVVTTDEALAGMGI
jgi:nicotinamidase-related amidase